MKTIDIHAHALITEAEEIARKQDRWRDAAAQAAAQMSVESSAHNRQLMQTTYADPLTRVETRIAAMDAMRIDMQAVSPVPTQYHYWAERATAERIVDAANRGIAAICARRSDRFAGLGTVAMQYPELAVAQLEHAITTLKLRGVMLSTSVNGIELADPRHEPFWAKAEALGAMVFIHPMGCSLGERLRPYYLSNVIGNPTETTVALAHLIFAGVFDRYPGLKVCAAHGGGYLPFYSGRFDHGWRVRPEARTCKNPPSSYIKRIWFDSLVYTAESLRELVRSAGATQVVLGTDYPFDMGVDDPIARLDAAGLSSSEREAIAGANAARLLGIER